MEQQNETLQILRLKGNVSFLLLESLLQISVAYYQFSESRVTSHKLIDIINPACRTVYERNFNPIRDGLRKFYPLYRGKK